MSSEYIRSYNVSTGVDIEAILGESMIKELEGYVCCRDPLDCVAFSKSEAKGYYKGFCILKLNDIICAVTKSRDHERVYAHCADPRTWGMPSGYGTLESTQFDPEPFIDHNAPLYFRNTTVEEDLTPGPPNPLPDFDIVINNWSKGKLLLKGVRLMHNGDRVDMDNIVSERPYKYVAKHIIQYVLAPKNNKIIEDHEGMVYNPYTERYSWL